MSDIPSKINLKEKLGLISQPWQPGLVARVNDHLVKLVKLDGEFIWHKHDREDELFLVLEGRMTIHFRTGRVDLAPGELVSIPKGVEHKPEAEPGTAALVFEPEETVNTGDAGGERTHQPDWL